jgi:hypothetical protein
LKGILLLVLLLIFDFDAACCSACHRHLDSKNSLDCHYDIAAAATSCHAVRETNSNSMHQLREPQPIIQSRVTAAAAVHQTSVTHKNTTVQRRKEHSKRVCVR